MKRFASTLLVLLMLSAAGCGWCQTTHPVVCCPAPCASSCAPVVVHSPTTSYRPVEQPVRTNPSSR